ncbi:hypothetical protein CCR83_13695 [Rhodobacter veldkampii DSM 11550]|uniref:Uncharacterized protein n=2 Tax=Phaeovulum veldkampii TaxID=33049 RepID=A0A2T4J6H0_9RHOB|nr:hypothetical protein [Phaeovulum veldkampii DSM 11550]PTE13490.1 hypothetical protein C5F46_15605 [Phaeovulum veldkampii DSM 11550]
MSTRCISDPKDRHLQSIVFQSVFLGQPVRRARQAQTQPKETGMTHLAFPGPAHRANLAAAEPKPRLGEIIAVLASGLKCNARGLDLMLDRIEATA